MKITEFLFIACFFACAVPAYHAAPSLRVSCTRSTTCNMQQYIGCYVMDGICRCAQEVCCESPFNYSSLESCRAENKVIMEDPCKQAPCKHNGYCVQIRGSATYRCQCEGTGYFGPRCHAKCPRKLRKAIYRLSESKARFARRRIYYMLACRI